MERIDLTAERIQKKVQAGERLVFTLSEIPNFNDLDGYTAGAEIRTWNKGFKVLTEVTASIDYDLDELTVNLTKEQSAALPPLCELRLKLIKAAEPETILLVDLFTCPDGGMI